MESRGSSRWGPRLPGGRGRIYWRLPTALLAVVLTVAFSCSTKSEADLANETLKQGIAAQQAGRLPEAAADYRDVLVHDPKQQVRVLRPRNDRPDERSVSFGGVQLPVRAQQLNSGQDEQARTHR
jgi:hypothetical protein